jgi:hypothetical protein
MEIQAFRKKKKKFDMQLLELDKNGRVHSA